VTARLVTMGRVDGPWGVKGWIKVRPYTETPESLCRFARWWLSRGGEWKEYEVAEATARPDSVVARLAGCDDREAAAALTGNDIAVPREALPATAANEFYWADLIGLQVVNEQGESLGEVAGLIATGANDVLRVSQDGKERLLPFIPQVVRKVDLARGEVQVDWGIDW
jgi:16S rRNA processing protein RimM